ncbi:MAG: SulP family inorganic anion transporter [Candidatus Thioglobus sp.]|jgi:SulP family sulfate permease|uniref:SulP family inorganic anion transporter n=1 Tax=Candidatus Thioglobus sp. TaxID=2026721 RepID=UPI0001BD377E|nr:SulP family inorganic anion transporter [Candidatus Thioglobus sp.]EEZ80141.1 MAG: sulfate permease family protein [uncultured Candidatus Thioglobus sp.]MBT3186463.1 SulP family inorganic anion transporter [Candidatus Thioglobus sp.]MBT3431478.1 SulP family inorganic anion transporter [Candidatus Thioglobus sp.]MBT3965750.1 SulP family inorganic anion transporter [Candidatus Thioglobus sp.]MBT4316461.1 SulP family inorganic anion transporter [Candidatus Thioglobus sp.]
MKLIENLHFNNIRGDITGGITAGVVALPFAIAMGLASGAGAIAGLYGAIITGFFAALFGGTGAQVSGPTGPMTVVMALVVTQFVTFFEGKIDPLTGLVYTHDAALGAGLTIAFTTVVLGGLFQITFGLLKLGRFINLMPHPVTSGFMTGIGVIIIILQIPQVLGFYDIKGSTLGIFSQLGDVPNYFINTGAISIAIVTIVVVYLLPKKIGKFIPSPLFALITGTLVLLFFPEFFSSNVEPLNNMILGDIPTGLPTFQMPSWEASIVVDMIASGMMLAILGSIDSLLTSLVSDEITRTHHKSDRELIGQGIGNTFSGLFGGLPGAGATMRTMTNVKAGGLTPISGALHAVLLLAIVLGGAQYAKEIPLAVLGAILVKVGTDIIDWDYLKSLVSAPKSGALIMVVVLGITVLYNLMAAVGVGLVMASLIFLQRMTDVQLASIVSVQTIEEASHLDEAHQELIRAGNTLFYQLNGPMSFGSAKGIVRDFSTKTNYNRVILDLSNVPIIDYTTSRGISEVCNICTEKSAEITIVGANTKVRHFLENIGIDKAFLT